MRRKTRHADQRAVTRDHLFQESLSSRKMSDFLFEAPAQRVIFNFRDGMKIPEKLKMAYNRVDSILDAGPDIADLISDKFPDDSDKQDKLSEDVLNSLQAARAAISTVAGLLKQTNDGEDDQQENLLAAIWLVRLIQLLQALQKGLSEAADELAPIELGAATILVNKAFSPLAESLTDSRIARGPLLKESGSDPLQQLVDEIGSPLKDADKRIKACFVSNGVVLRKLYVFAAKSTRFSIEAIFFPGVGQELLKVFNVLKGVIKELSPTGARVPATPAAPPALAAAARRAAPAAGGEPGGTEGKKVSATPADRPGDSKESDKDRGAAPAATRSDSSPAAGGARATGPADSSSSTGRRASDAGESSSSSGDKKPSSPAGAPAPASRAPASTAAPKKSLKAILGVGDDEAKKILPRVHGAGLSVSGLRDILTQDQIRLLAKALEDPEREMRADLASTFTESRRHRGEAIDSLVREMRASSSHAWEDAAHRRIWTSVGEEILREHLSGKKTLISEACFRAYVHVDDRLLAETAGRLDEGIISSAAEKIGSFFAKTFGKAFGGTKSRNWAIFGGGGEKETLRYRKAYLDGIQKSSDVLGKLSNATVRDIAREIETKNPEFPNGGTAEEFKSSIAGIWDAYRMIRIAAGDPLDADRESQEFGELQQITGDDANKAIRGLRQILQGYERELKDRYTYNMESRTRKMPTLVESLLLEKSEDAEGLGLYGQKASGVKGLESNLAPGILAGLGAAGVGFSWLTQQSFFMNMFANPAAAKDMVQIFTKTVGVTKQLAFLMGKPDANLSGMKLSEFLAEMTAKGLVKNGNPSAELLQMARDAGNENFANWWAQNLAGKSSDATLAKLIPLSGSGGSGAGGDILTKRVQNVVGQQVAEIGKLSATGTLVSSLGPLAGYLGAGALLAAGAVKSLRMFGRKNSRSAWIQALLDKMVDVPAGTEINLPAAADVEPPAGVPDQPKTGIVAKLLDDKTYVRTADDLTLPNGALLAPIDQSEASAGNDDKIKQKVFELLRNAFETRSIEPVDDKTVDDILRLDLAIEDERTLPAAAPAGEKKKLSVVLGMEPSRKNKRIFKQIMAQFDDAQISVADSGLSDDDKKSKLAKALEDHEEKLRDRLENTFVAESHDRKSTESIIIERWQRLAGIIK